MEATKREFIINELMVDDFIEHETNIIYLEEKDDTGKSELSFCISSKDNLVIKNVDSKNTQLLFFQDGSTKSMFKRVDHIIFENVAENDWKLHIVEMKSHVLVKRWREVKGKFRASYLLAQGIAAMLEMNLTEICMYTTYEKVDLELPDTMPSGRRLPLGEAIIKDKDEWDGRKVYLNFNTRLCFSHTPILMQRNKDDVLIGQYSCNM